MSLRAARHKLFALEEDVGRVVGACRLRAWQRLTYAEQDCLEALFEAQPDHVQMLGLKDIPHMDCPAWVTSPEWAALQRYAQFYVHAYTLEMGPYEPI